jgi:hypothetical protein
MAVVGGAYSPDSSEQENALRGILALLQLFAARPSLACFSFVEGRQALPPAARSRYESGISVLAAMLDRLRMPPEHDRSVPVTAARGAMGSAEVLIRRELLAGRASRLPELFPDLIYGALVPFLDQREALRYSEQAREMLKDGE